MATTTVPLRAIVGRPDLGLRALVGEPDDRPVRWVHICELRDPVPYLTGQELLLTAGVDFPTSRAEIDDYVRRLVGVGAAALGFGVTPIYDEVPPDLIDACRRHGLPLLLVPARVSFLVISQTVSLMLAAIERAGLRRLSLAQRVLTRAATRPDGFGSVVRQLAAELGDGWTLVVDGAGRTLAAGGPGAVPDPEEVGRLCDRVRAGKGASSATEYRPGGQLVAHILRPATEDSPVLLAGRAEPFTSADRAILSVAAALLTLLDAAGWNRAALAAALVARLVGNEADAPLAEVLGVSAGDGWRVIRSRPARRHATADAVAEVSAALGTPLVAGVGPDEVLAIVPEHGVELADPMWVSATSAPVRLAELPAAADRTGRLLADALAQGGSLREDGTGALDALVSDVDAAAFARARLGPLLGNRLLLTTLRAWLARGGGWEATAEALGVHRNTVRHRLARIGETLGCELSDPDTRAELWLALRWLG